MTRPTKDDFEAMRDIVRTIAEELLPSLLKFATVTQKVNVERQLWADTYISMLGKSNYPENNADKAVQLFRERYK